MKLHYNKYFCNFFVMHCLPCFLVLLLYVFLFNLINLSAVIRYLCLHCLKIFISDIMFVKSMAYTAYIYFNAHVAGITTTSARPTLLILIIYYDRNNHSNTFYYIIG